jgi:hypothetical protein
MGNHLVDLTTVRAADTPALRHLERLVRAATARPSGVWSRSAVRCRRRPKHSPCTGFIDVRRQDLPEVLQWACPVCGEVGLARGWRHSPWRIQPSACAGRATAITVPESAYRVLERSAPPDDLAQRVVRGAVVDEDGICLRGGVDTFQRLYRHLRAVERVAQGARARRARLAASAVAAELSRSATERGESRPG